MPLFNKNALPARDVRFAARNRFGFPFRRDNKVTVTYPKVSLVHWRPRDGSLNFGDELGPVVTALMLSTYGASPYDVAAAPKRLLTIGSILHLAQSDDVVWGSGVNGKVDRAKFKFDRLDVRAVRGPLTKGILEQMGVKVPAVFGDPALLLPKLIGKRVLRNDLGPVVVVPNLNDLKLGHIQSVSPNTELVDPRWPWIECVQAIANAEFVAASSLHGIIIAEAYGVPVRPLRLSDAEHILKYEDYFEGTGRSLPRFASSLPEALSMGAIDPLRACNTEALVSSFPADLWL